MGILKIEKGFTLIEALAVVAILAILMTLSVFTFMTQLAKGRDAKRKADLEKLRTVLEDYMNDNSCYPQGLACPDNFPPYLSQVPCDPLNNARYNYFYSFDATKTCQSWYKIYAKLENTNDPIIIKVGCASGCGPSGNYNYWISSPNMTEVGQLPGESWPTIPTGVPTSPPPTGGPTNTPPIVSTPTPTPGGPTATPGLTATPTPTSTPAPTPMPTPTSPPGDNFFGCFSGFCKQLSGPICQPNYNYADCLDLCGTPQDPKNECL